MKDDWLDLLDMFVAFDSVVPVDAAKVGPGSEHTDSSGAGATESGTTESVAMLACLEGVEETKGMERQSNLVRHTVRRSWPQDCY